MGFGEAVRSVFSNYATFSGRARRAEYWWFVLFNIIGSAITGTLDYILFGGTVVETIDSVAVVIENSPLNALFGLLVFLPGLSVTVRRLHDVGRSGWWFWIILIPLVGFILLLYWTIRRGDVGPNQYGPDPITDGGYDGYGGSSVPRVPRS
ncbi:MAG: DUF805 domain-containing protein [Cereibacter sphaeroides]|uniref:DUF805 domain-containing protein n=1 Tax=Cereibacter sphaeroides TaxID=1063 RepID=A0A2W5TLU1_CERSP|nr:MAG: DUF805 domain-containing protein [Cereibacter sphaeroides]